MMAAAFPIVFTSPVALIVALLALGGACVIAVVRRVPISRITRTFFGIGLLLLALAAGRPLWHRPTPGVVTVMVDLSPSTRGATFRDRAALDQRIHALLGNVNYRVIAFADKNQPMPQGAALADIPADHTVFDPPPADAILLFSDGRFDLPATAARTFPVIDPALDHLADAVVSRLDYRGKQVVAAVTNNGPPRTLTWSGARAEETSPITGSLIRLATPVNGGEISATLSPGDRWPENDSLSIRPAPPLALQQWWIGARDPGANWRRFSPDELPVDAADYLDPAIIVLDNIPADALSAEQRDRLAQYARDLGGGVVIIGGDHAFAAGGYDGTVLDAISPLASSPPQPTTHWILLVDGSGSMAADAAGGGTKWQAETRAVTRVLPALPPDDLVSLGSFAESLNWWSTGKSARDTAGLPLPPTDASPRGPTNLQPALRQVIDAADGSMPVQLLVMTDAETDLTDLTALAQAMSLKKIHLYVLAFGHGDALPALRSIASATGGSVIEQLDPRQWANSARQLMQSAMPDRLSQEKVEVRYTGELASLGNRIADLWDRTWLKPSATELAKSESSPMAARWQVGTGQVAAVAYRATVADIAQLASVVSAPPHDPRFTVDWQTGSKLRVSVNAVDQGSYLNGEKLELELADLSATPAHREEMAIPQTAPGRYELEMSAPQSPVVATVRDGSRVLQRFAVAGRYAPEFDVIGNDRANLAALAEQTGGKVIEPGPTQAIDFHWPVQAIPLTPLLATLGGALLAGGLVQWKRRGHSTPM
jgi:hypothetical protein